MKFAAIQGARIAYRIDGSDTAPVVMLSNSLMSTHAMWERQMPALLERYRVLRYDTRGHGASETTPGPYSIELLADDAAALIAAAGTGPVHFVGLSMGGMIGQQLAIRHPQLVRSLALCDTASEMPPRSLWEERFAVARAEGIEGLVEGTIKRWFVASFIEADPAAIDEVRSFILQTRPDGYIACASAVRDMSQTHLLQRITAPTVIIVGRDDPACTLAASEVLHREIRHSALHIIDNAAHLSNIEQPQEFNARLLDFLDQQPRAGQAGSNAVQ